MCGHVRHVCARHMVKALSNSTRAVGRNGSPNRPRLQVSRKTVSKYRAWAQQHELLPAPIAGSGGPAGAVEDDAAGDPPPPTPSKVMPFRDQVIALRQRGEECRAWSKTNST